jgi:hypothetical protein
LFAVWAYALTDPPLKFLTDGRIFLIVETDAVWFTKEVHHFNSYLTAQELRRDMT